MVIHTFSIEKSIIKVLQKSNQLNHQIKSPIIKKAISKHRFAHTPSTINPQHLPVARQLTQTALERVKGRVLGSRGPPEHWWRSASAAALSSAGASAPRWRTPSAPPSPNWRAAEPGGRRPLDTPPPVLFTQFQRGGKFSPSFARVRCAFDGFVRWSLSDVWIRNCFWFWDFSCMFFVSGMEWSNSVFGNEFYSNFYCCGQ